MTRGWKTNRKTGSKFFIPRTAEVKNLKVETPERLKRFPYDPNQPFAKEIDMLVPALRDIRVVFHDEGDPQSQYGDGLKYDAWVDYGTKTTPTVIHIDRDSVIPVETFWHEVGHIVEDRMSKDLREKWKKAEKKYSREQLEAVFYVPYPKEQKSSRLVQEELFAELFIARALGWRYARLSARPQTYLPELWAVVDEAWRHARRE